MMISRWEKNIMKKLNMIMMIKKLKQEKKTLNKLMEEEHESALQL